MASKITYIGVDITDCCELTTETNKSKILKIGNRKIIQCSAHLRDYGGEWFRAISGANTVYVDRVSKILYNGVSLAQKRVTKISTPAYLPSPALNDIVASCKFETTYDEDLSNFLFNTNKSAEFLAPERDSVYYISILEQENAANMPSADFRISINLLKTNATTPVLYIGGFEGIKLPLSASFDLKFNNKRTDFNYIVLEVPPKTLLKLTLELLAVNE